jgi:CheY-like chemotaxis protein
MAARGVYKLTMKNLIAPPLAVRLIGYQEADRDWLQGMLDAPSRADSRYRILAEDNLRDPDFLLVNAAHPQAIAMLERLQPSAVRPALLLGAAGSDSGHASLSWPASSVGLHAAIAQLLARRAEVLSGLPAHARVPVPERRRHLDGSAIRMSPGEWKRHRRDRTPGDIVVLDDGRDLAAMLGRLVRPRHLKVQRVNNEAAAAIACAAAPVRLLLVSLPAADVDPYRLCAGVKAQSAGAPSAGAPSAAAPSVVFLVADQQDYRVDPARRAGCDGFLDRPLEPTQLISLVEKFLPDGGAGRVVVGGGSGGRIV